MSSGGEPIGGNPLTNSDLFGGKAREWPMGHFGGTPDPKLS